MKNVNLTVLEKTRHTTTYKVMYTTQGMLKLLEKRNEYKQDFLTDKMANLMSQLAR